MSASKKTSTTTPATTDGEGASPSLSISTKYPSANTATVEAPSTNPALEEPDAMAIIQKGQSVVAAVSTDRKKQLLIQARAERRKWIQKAPLPYQTARDPNNLWEWEDRLYPVQSAMACQRLPTATKVLSELYGLEQNTRTPEEVAQRVESLVRPFLNADGKVVEQANEALLTRAFTDDHDGNEVVQAYLALWTTLMKPECALLIQAMRNFLGNLQEGENSSMDRVSGALKSYIESTLESLKNHVAWKANAKSSEPVDFAQVKRSLESFLYGQAQPLLAKLEWTGLFTMTEQEWMERLGKLQFVQPSHLEIECLSGDGTLSVDELLKEPLKAMLSIDQYYSPYEKLQRILAVYKGVNSALSMALNTNKETERKLPSADDVLPTIILTVLRAKPSHIFRNLQLVEVFSPQEYLRGEAGYAYTNLYGAVQFLQDLDMDKPNSLSISPEDFRKGLEESVAKAQTRLSIVPAEEEGGIDTTPAISTNISVQDVRAARLNGEQIDLEWAIRHQKEHPDKYGLDGEANSVTLAVLPEGFKRSYGFVSTTPQDIRMSDLPQLLSEYKMLVHASEQLIGERGARMAMEKKKKNTERKQQLGDGFFGITNSSSSRDRSLTS